MSQINFAPWRQVSRERLKKHYLLKLSASALLAIIFIFIWTSAALGRLEYQGKRNLYLEKNIAVMEEKIIRVRLLKNRKNEIILRMKAIQDLQGNRVEIVQAFDELVRAIPSGIVFSSLNYVAGVIQISGFAESNSTISALMRNLDNSYKYQHPNLKKIQKNPDSNIPGSKFDLQIAIEISVRTEIRK
ncbi:MAG: PilN domain-containing protein [Porticoccaceae bacterium]